jgi:hypothetical protein
LTQLIAVIISIAIMAVVVTGGANFISIDAYTKIGLKNEIMTSYQTLKSGQLIYKEHTDSQLPTANWDTLLSSYVHLPNDIMNSSWSYNQNGYGRYFCLSGNVSEKVLFESINEISDKLSQNSYYVNTDCGATTNFALQPDLSTLPKISATFYIK